MGFRVRSQRGTQFRQWANERLRQPVTAGLPDYFDELLERIRDIRASEQRLYLRVEDILALAADYQPSDAQTQTMFKTVQNKLPYAVTGLTAPEIIAQELINNGAPQRDRVRKSLQAPRQPTVEGNGKTPMASPLPQPIWEGCTDEQSP